MENTLKKPMTGIIPPLVTPLLDNDKLDIDGLERLIERLIKGGVHGLFILGTTGKAQSISYRLRHEMIKETCRINAGRLPVLVCISGQKGSASNALRIFSRSGTLKRWKGAATKSSQTPNKDNAHFNPFK